MRSYHIKCFLFSIHNYPLHFLTTWMFQSRFAVPLLYDIRFRYFPLLIRCSAAEAFPTADHLLPNYRWVFCHSESLPPDQVTRSAYGPLPTLTMPSFAAVRQLKTTFKTRIHVWVECVPKLSSKLFRIPRSRTSLLWRSTRLCVSRKMHFAKKCLDSKMRKVCLNLFSLFNLSGRNRTVIHLLWIA